MAAGLLTLRSGGLVSVRSAGSDPADAVNPLVVAAMAELGVDLAKAFPKPLTDDAVRASDVVVTMGCGDACPIYPASATRTGRSTTRRTRPRLPRSGAFATTSTHVCSSSSESSGFRSLSSSVVETGTKIEGRPFGPPL